MPNMYRNTYTGEWIDLDDYLPVETPTLRNGIKCVVNDHYPDGGWEGKMVTIIDAVSGPYIRTTGIMGYREALFMPEELTPI